MARSHYYIESFGERAVFLIRTSAFTSWSQPCSGDHCKTEIYICLKTLYKCRSVAKKKNLFIKLATIGTCVRPQLITNVRGNIKTSFG